MLESLAVGNGAAIITGSDLVPGVAAQRDEFMIVDGARHQRRGSLSVAGGEADKTNESERERRER
jgi:hypothetical protein